MQSPRYEWYQTESHITIILFIKNITKEDINVSINGKKLICSIRNNEYNLELNLAHNIQVESNTINILSSKIELKFKKGEFVYWSKLENNNKDYNNVKVKNWDKIVQNIGVDDDIADDLHKQFQKTYEEASENDQRAMNKSFVESNGTVLNTSWEDLSKKSIEMIQPADSEYKKI